MRLFHQNRQNLLHLLDQASLEEANAIPPGYRNNILWNAGHILAAHQFLLYAQFQKPLQVPEELLPRYAKDTFPTGTAPAEEFEQIRNYLRQTADQTLAGYRNGVFDSGTYTPYASEYFGTEVHSIQDAIHFNTYHEGVHFGYILALRRILASEKSRKVAASGLF